MMILLYEQFENYISRLNYFGGGDKSCLIVRVQILPVADNKINFL